MAKNLAGKTYEVLTADENRWIFESSFDVRSAALEHAEELLHQGNYDGVRVTSESERTGELDVIFEERRDREKIVTLVAVDDAPLCEEVLDYYGFPARRTTGKLLRHLLDDQGLTALELAFDAGQLMMFERNDRLFGPAMQRIGGLQAKASGTKPMDRVEVLHKAFAEIKEWAKKPKDADKYAALLRSKGLNALVDGATQWENTPGKARLAILGALAGLLASRGNWNGKLLALISLTQNDVHERSVEYVDEVTAEILDGAEAVMEVLAGQPDAASANRRLIQLTRGNTPEPGKQVSCIVELNNMMSRLDLPLTCQVLLERVAAGIGGIRPLTREGGDMEKDAFAGLVRELTDEDGLAGGPGMCDAIIKRARMTLKSGTNDLTFEQGIDHLLDLMPNRAVRLGCLLDLAASPLRTGVGAGAGERELVHKALERLIQQLAFMASLVPDTSSSETVARVVEKLKRRADGVELPGPLAQNLLDALNEIAGRKGHGGNDTSKGVTNSYKMKDGSLNANDQTGERKTVPSGELIFGEDEVGDMAYLIISGDVEIFRSSGNRERVLATLGRGEIIGEMSLVDNAPRVASARALSDCQLSMISRASLKQRLDRLEENDRVLRRLISVLVSRIRGQAESPE
ncbi:MAG: cyclic nucleotide-binding domain-containing protein [Alphaproteobacteria bacterium]|nr:cyclic nucleotide-binding domain-containing protein [Alphaproteobacteria bacterium]